VGEDRNAVALRQTALASDIRDVLVGNRPGNLHMMTVLGPVAAVIKAADSRAMRIAEQPFYGLGGGILDQNERARKARAGHFDTVVRH
jgi:acyl-CoA reductase-like NAD-dependent aldehyde dehydrogenase